MSVDEALLVCNQQSSGAILRFYQWSEDTVSLGRFQHYADFNDQSQPCVRRITSGGALLHRRDELTYALIARYRLLGSRDAKVAYHKIHAVLAQALVELGVHAEQREPVSSDEAAAFCYNRVTNFDLVAGDQHKKLIGSAQRRLGRVFLQHGAIPLSDDGGVERGTSLESLLGTRPSLLVLKRAIRRAFEATFGVQLVDSELSEAEMDKARDFEATRYALESWTQER